MYSVNRLVLHRSMSIETIVGIAVLTAIAHLFHPFGWHYADGRERRQSGRSRASASAALKAV